MLDTLLKLGERAVFGISGRLMVVKQVIIATVLAVTLCLTHVVVLLALAQTLLVLLVQLFLAAELVGLAVEAVVDSIKFVLDD